MAARRQGGAAIEDADVVQPQEAAFKDVAPVAVLAVDPPGEVHEQLLEGMCQPAAVTLSLRPFIQVVSKNRGPGVDRRVDVAEVPLIGGHLPVGVEVAFAQHQVELLLGVILVHQRQRQNVEG